MQRRLSARSFEYLALIADSNRRPVEALGIIPILAQQTSVKSYGAPAVKVVLRRKRVPASGGKTAVTQPWRDQGKRQQAHYLLARVCGWFTEGFDTLDLKEAKGLLNELNV
jgi:hypothetical protein